jgi:parallel beta-helix repeat protein
MGKIFIIFIFFTVTMVLTGEATATQLIQSNTKLNSDLQNNIQIKSSNVTLDCDNHVLNGLGIKGHGIYASEVVNITIKNCVLKNFTGHGISFAHVSNSRIINNTISEDRGGTGCGIIWQGDSNKILKNRVSDYKTGICNWWQSQNSEIRANQIKGNQGGVLIHESSENRIYENEITSNGYGIFIRTKNSAYKARNNTINRNLIENNEKGVVISKNSLENLIYQNNFINNTIQSEDSESTTNHWHKEELSRGNYWSDYHGADDGSGLNLHSLAGDGVGDTLLPHPEVGKDNYPYMEADGWFIKVSLTIDPHVIGFFGPRWITAYIELPPGYSVREANTSTVELAGVKAITDAGYNWVTVEGEFITDIDGDGVNERMIRFERKNFDGFFNKTQDVSLALKGRLNDEESFHGKETIKISRPYLYYQRLKSGIRSLFKRI